MNTTFTPRQKHLFFKIILISIFLINSAFSITYNENLKANTTLSQVQDTIYHTEKVFLHFDKPYYSSGDNMWFKVYLVRANSNRTDAISKIVYVELIDPLNRIVHSRTIKIDNGGGEGEFYLPKRLNPGAYTVRAYTNFMRNFDESYFFLKKINIGNPNSLTNNQTSSIKNPVKNIQKKLPVNLKPDIQFFPEGGYMINDQTSQIGFKAIDVSGKGIAVSGSIVDNTGSEIASFNTKKFGLGRFRLTPRQGTSYKATITYRGENYTYDLPDALDIGVTMKVTERKNSYQVYLQSSLPNGVDQLILTGIQNGMIVNIAELAGTKNKGIIKVPKSTIRQGMTQFIILDETEKPLCERLVFVETDQAQPKVDVIADKNQYFKRELIELDLEIDPITQANMSLAVTDISVVEPDQYGLDIRSHLLLNSELKGEIEQPGYYFQANDPERKKMLDLLMMTQGWRQFLWNHVDESKEKKEYAHETGIRFKGIVKEKFNPKKTAAVELSLTYKNATELVHDKTSTLKDGRFIFGDYHFNDSTAIIIQAKKYKTNKRAQKQKVKIPNMNYMIELDPFVSPTLTGKQEYLEVPVSNKPIVSDYLTRPKMKVLENTVNPFEGDFEKLEEVKLKYIKAREIEREKLRNRQTIYHEPTYRVDMDDIQTFGTTSALAALQGKVPGLSISTDGFTIFSISIRGASFSLTGERRSPLILLDNMPVGDISSILAEDVSFVDVLSPTRAAIFGQRAMGGVINIHTKRGTEDYQKSEIKERNGIINFIHPGYYKARRFYKPNYQVSKPEHKNFDYRSTLYWNPTLKFNQNGKATISFYAADISTTYRVELQGISTDGSPIKNEIYVDVK